MTSVRSSTTTRLEGEEVLEVTTSADFSSTLRFDGDIDRWETVSDERSSLTTLEDDRLDDTSDFTSVLSSDETFLEGDDDDDVEEELDLRSAFDSETIFEVGGVDDCISVTCSS